MMLCRGVRITIAPEPFIAGDLIRVEQRPRFKLPTNARSADGLAARRRPNPLSRFSSRKRRSTLQAGKHVFQALDLLEKSPRQVKVRSCTYSGSGDAVPMPPVAVAIQPLLAKAPPIRRRRP